VTPTLVKLGGSVITVKDEKFTPNISAIHRLVSEVARAKLESLIVVHGGGSFGHPLAKEHNIVQGYKSPSQLMGFSKTRRAMMALNKLVLDAFILYNLPMVTIQPSACVITKRGRIHKIDLAPIQKLLDMGFIPLLYGDAVLDGSMGFTILSGDQLTAELAIRLNGCKIIIILDVDGIFTEDPKVNRHAKLIKEVSVKEMHKLLNSIGETGSMDVTKGMYGKISELIPALEHGVQTTMVNGKIPNRLYKALKGEEVRGTKILPR
jgi:isopentenyl phosphate kinase